MLPLRALLLSLSLALPALAADAPPGVAAPAVRNDFPETEEAFKMAAKLDGFEIDYRDLQDRKVDFQEFARLMNDGILLSMSKNKETKTATVKALDPKAAPAAHKIKPGEQVPDFKLAKVGGGSVDKTALHGKPVLVNFMFADCAPCVQEVPELNAMAAGRQDLQFVAVTSDAHEVAEKFAAAHGFKWTLLSQGRDWFEAMGVRTYPSFALIGADGTLLGIANRAEIVRADRSLDAWVARLLAARAAPAKG